MGRGGSSYEERHELRQHNLYLGMDTRLEPLVRAGFDSRGDQMSENDERLVRQAAHRYEAAIAWIEKALDEGDPASAVLALAQEALAELPADEPALNGPHTSARMCQWIVHDYFISLARIADLEGAPDELITETARKRVARHRAGLSFR